MSRWLLLALVTIPFVELYLLIQLGQLIGFWPTIAITLGTAMVGSAVARREGFRVIVEWRRAMDERRPPHEGLLSGVLILLGGALLIAPGVLTDLIGFALMVPAVRRLLSAPVRGMVERRMATGPLHVSGDPFGASAGSPNGGAPPGWPGRGNLAGGVFPEQGPLRRRPDVPPRGRPSGRVVETTGENVSDER